MSTESLETEPAPTDFERPEQQPFFIHSNQAMVATFFQRSRHILIARNAEIIVLVVCDNIISAWSWRVCPYEQLICASLSLSARLADKFTFAGFQRRSSFGANGFKCGEGSLLMMSHRVKHSILT